MKKILLLLLGLTITSCSTEEGSDTRTTDPLIGNWQIIGLEDDSGTILFNSNGTFIEELESYEGIEEGSWFNLGENYSNLDQSYVITYDAPEGIYSDDYEGSLMSAIFNKDFSQVELLNYSDGITANLSRVN